MLVFREVLPSFLVNLYLFGFGKWIAIKFGLANVEKVSEGMDHIDLLMYLDSSKYNKDSLDTYKKKSQEKADSTKDKHN